MKFFPNSTYLCRQGNLDIHMDIFELLAEPEPACLYLRCNITEATDYSIRIPGRYNPLFCQHFSVCNTALNVMTPEPFIKGDRFSKRLNRSRRFVPEPASPRLFHKYIPPAMCIISR